MSLSAGYLVAGSRSRVRDDSARIEEPTRKNNVRDSEGGRRRKEEKGNISFLFFSLKNFRERFD